MKKLTTIFSLISFIIRDISISLCANKIPTFCGKGGSSRKGAPKSLLDHIGGLHNYMNPTESLFLDSDS
jgi:hypothetical protein